MQKRTLFTLSFLISIMLIDIPITQGIYAQEIQTVRQQPDLSKAVITPEELSPGFTIASPADLSKIKEELTQENLVVQSIFQLQKIDLSDLEVIMGGTFIPSGKLAKADLSSFEAERIMRSLMAGLDNGCKQNQGINLCKQKPQELTNIKNIGNASVGLTQLVNIMGFPMRMDMVVFRRDQVFAFTFIGYLDGNVPKVTVADIASKLDTKILQYSQ